MSCLPRLLPDDGCDDPLGCVEGRAQTIPSLSAPCWSCPARSITWAKIRWAGLNWLCSLAITPCWVTRLNWWLKIACAQPKAVKQRHSAWLQIRSIVGAIGTNCSSAAQGAIPIISEAGLVMIAPSNTSPRLTNDDIATGGSHMPGYFRTSQNGLIEGRRLAEFAALALKCGNPRDRSRWRSRIQKGLPERSPIHLPILTETSLFEGAVNKGDTDMASILTEIAIHQPDVIYVPLFEPESNFFAAQMSAYPRAGGQHRNRRRGQLFFQLPREYG